MQLVTETDFFFFFSHFSLDCLETSSGTHTRHVPASGNHRPSLNIQISKLLESKAAC